MPSYKIIQLYLPDCTGLKFSAKIFFLYSSFAYYTLSTERASHLVFPIDFHKAVLLARTHLLFQEGATRCGHCSAEPIYPESKPAEGEGELLKEA